MLQRSRAFIKTGGIQHKQTCCLFDAFSSTDTSALNTCSCRLGAGGPLELNWLHGTASFCSQMEFHSSRNSTCEAQVSTGFWFKSICWFIRLARENDNNFYREIVGRRSDCLFTNGNTFDKCEKNSNLRRSH